MRCTDNAIRYIYCLPRTGVIDILSGIAVAWDYADRSERTLVVDTRLSMMGDVFGRYFVPLVGNAIFDPPGELLACLNRQTVHPVWLKGRVDTHEVENAGKGVFREVESGELLTFNPRLEYEEDVIVLESADGGRHSARVLPRLRLREELAEEIEERLRPMAGGYVAVHVPKGERSGAYRAFFKKIFPRVKGRKVMVDAENPKVQDFARSFFGTSLVVSVTSLSGVAGLSGQCKNDPFGKNLGMLTVLFALAFADELFVAGEKSANAEEGLSGIPILAMHLNRVPEVRNSVFGSGLF